MPIEPNEPSEPSEIKFRIFTENNETHTRFAVARSDTLVFQNDSDQVLQVTVDKGDALFECGKPVKSFEVAANGQKSFSINPHYGLESTFKYSAKIGSSLIEDPVIIIDKH